MKIMQIIKEEVVPLSSKHNVVLLIIIACAFQFALFYAPALADEAVAQAKAQASDEIITIDLAKDQVMDQEAAIISDQGVPSASSTPEKAAVKETAAKEIKVIRTSTHVITAYNSEPGQTDSDPCTTANGFNVCKSEKEDTIAANFLKFGSKVMIPELFGDRVFVVRDRMNKRHANRVDVWMKDYDDAIHFGIKVAKIQVIE